MTNLLAAALPHGQFWAILPSYATATAHELRNESYEAHMAEYQAKAATIPKTSGRVNPEDRPYPIQNGVAVIRIEGVMTKRPTSYGMGTSTLLLTHAVRLAARDEAAKSILLIVASPGGSVEGVQELHDEIKAATLKKNVTSFFQDGAYSAAYWAPCASSRIVINKTGATGSLGAMAVLEDSSEAYAEDGIKVILFATGHLKGQGTDGLPISEEAQDMYQGRVNELGAWFAAAIADGRKMEPEAVAEVFTGGIFSAQKALELGLVDAIGTLDEAFADLLAQETEDDDEPIEARADLPAPGIVVMQTPPIPTSPPEPSAATPTISAPQGGEYRPRAENAKPTASEKPHMDNWKNRLADAFRSRGKGVVASSLDNSTREDPESTARVVSDSIDAQVAEHLANDPLMRSMKARGLNSVEDLNAFAELHDVGAKALATARENATKACIAAKGQDRGAVIAKQLEHQSYGVVMANLEAWNAEIDANYGTGEDKPAKRQTAATGTVAVDAEQPAPEKRAWDKLDASTQTQAMADYKLDTPEKQDKFAANLPESAFKGGN